MKITAEQFDAWRVVPRLLMGLYGWACFYVLMWFTSLADPSTAQTTFASAIWGGAGVWFGFYVNSGKTKWDSVSRSYSSQQPPQLHSSGGYMPPATMQGQTNSAPNAPQHWQR